MKGDSVYNVPMACKSMEVGDKSKGKREKKSLSGRGECDGGNVGLGSRNSCMMA